MFLINSRQGYFNCAPPCGREALSLTYGRFFAEFLEDLSLVRLGLLDLTTCVGLLYGVRLIRAKRFFLEACSIKSLLSKQEISASLGVVMPGFTWTSSSRHEPKSNNGLDILHSVTPSHQVYVTEY